MLDQVFFFKQTSPPNETVTNFLFTSWEHYVFKQNLTHRITEIKHHDLNGKIISSYNFCWSLNVCYNNQSLIPHLMFDPVTCYFWYQIAKEILKRPIYNTSFLNTIIPLSVNFSLFSFYKPFGISFFDQMTNFNVLKWYTLLTTISVIHYFYCLLSANVHEYTNA